MSREPESNVVGARWRMERRNVEKQTAMTDRDVAREVAASNVRKRATQAIDRQRAMEEYQADRRAVYVNADRLKALRLARDAAGAKKASAAKKPSRRKAVASRSPTVGAPTRA